MLRLNVISDVHAHPFKNAQGDPAARIDDAAAVLQVWAGAPNDRIKILAGDLFHAKGSLPTTAANAVWQALALHRDVDALPGIILAGNHDIVGQGTTESAIRPAALVGRWTAVEEPHVFTYRTPGQTGTIIALPYYRFVQTEKQAIHDAILACIGNRRDPATPLPSPVVLLAHQYLSSDITGEENMDEAWVDGLSQAIGYTINLVICGHDHRARPLWFRGSTSYLVPGAPLQHGWGDAGQHRRGVHVDVAEGSVACWDVPYRAPRFHIVEGEQWPTDVDPEIDYVRVVAQAGTVVSCPQELTHRVELLALPEVVSVQRTEIRLQNGPADVLAQYLDHVSPGNARRSDLLALGLELYRDANPGEVVA